MKKCGSRFYWNDWANSIADIARKHITRIDSIVKHPDTPARKAFDSFVAEIKNDLNPGIKDTDAVEMLAQHIITRPVFDTLVSGKAIHIRERCFKSNGKSAGPDL